MSSESISMEDMKKEIKKIKSNMIDPDSILTEEDYIFLQKYRKEKEKGQLQKPTSNDDISGQPTVSLAR